MLITKIVTHFPQTLILSQNYYSSTRRHKRKFRSNLIFYFPPVSTCAHTAPSCVFFCVGKQTRSYACGTCKQSTLISLPYKISAIKYIALSEEWHSLKHRTTFLVAMFSSGPKGDSPDFVVWYLIGKEIFGDMLMSLSWHHATMSRENF